MSTLCGEEYALVNLEGELELLKSQLLVLHHGELRRELGRVPRAVTVDEDDHALPSRIRLVVLLRAKPPGGVRANLPGVSVVSFVLERPATRGYTGSLMLAAESFCLFRNASTPGLSVSFRSPQSATVWFGPKRGAMPGIC